MIQCNEIVRDPLGNKCFCNMKPVRTDRFKDWIIKNGHICSPGEPVNQRSLKEMVDKMNGQKPTEVVTEEMIHREIAKFTGKYNLSLDTLSSQEFYDLCLKLISLGTPKRSLIQSSPLYHPLRRDKLRAYLVDEAIKIHRQRLRMFSNLPYTCLSIDEGTTKGYHNLHFILENPLNHRGPHPFDTLRMTGGKADHYVNSLTEGFMLLSKVGIKIGSVVCDGCPAQKKAFDYDWTESVRHKDIEDIDKIIFVPCLCHRIDNAYKSVAQKNSDFQTILSKMHDILQICIENSDKIGAICPNHCDSRWIYDLEIVNFLLKHSQLIEEKYYPEFPEVEFNHLRKCLVIYRTLISFFETPKTQFQSAFRLLEKGINALFELARTEKNPYASCMAYSLQNYTLFSSDGGLWCLGYCFTVKGRKDLRNRNIKQCNPFPTGYLNFFDFDKSFEDDDISTDCKNSNLEDILITIDGVDISFEKSNSSDEEFEEGNDEEEDDLEEEIIEAGENYIDYLNSAKKN